MIRATLVTLALLALGTPTRAGEVGLGPLLLVNRTCLRSADVRYTAAGRESTCEDDREPSTLVGGGLLLEVPRGRLALRTGLQYAPKRFAYSISRYSGYLRLNHLEVPLQAKAAFGSGWTKVYAAAGPVVGLRLGSPSQDLPFDGERHDEWSRFDLGLRFGGGAQLDLQRFTFVMDLQYGHGLVDAYAGSNFVDRARGLHFTLALTRRIGERKEARHAE